MSVSQFRYRSGVVQTIYLATDPSFPISEGDMVGNVAGVARPLSSFATVAAAVAAFAGIATRKVGLQPGETSFNLPGVIDPGYIQVAVSGDWEMDCATGITWVAGNRVAPVALTYTNYPAWTNGVVYQAGQRVYSGTSIYVCQKTHTSAASFGAEATGVWTQVYLYDQRVAVASDYTTQIATAIPPYNQLGVATPGGGGLYPPAASAGTIVIRLRPEVTHDNVTSGE